MSKANHDDDFIYLCLPVYVWDALHPIAGFVQGQPIGTEFEWHINVFCKPDIKLSQSKDIPW